MSCNPSLAAAALALAGVVFSPCVASAAPPPAPTAPTASEAAPSAPTAPTASKGDERPWAKGVSKADQDKATALFEEATDLLKEAFFKRAVDLYRQALEHWDHPAIHFNLAKALMNLDDPAAAYRELEASMRFDGAPLSDDEIDQVKRFTKLLYETELAKLVVKTDEADAKVSLDGVPLFVGPGTWEGVVRPATAKALVASKPGFQTAQIAPELKVGQVNEVDITLEPLELVTRYVHEFDTWIPWAVLGGGVALLGGGGVLTWQSKKSFDAYDTAVASCNGDNAYQFVDDSGATVTAPGQVGTCVPTSATTSKKTQGSTLQKLSVAAYAVGGAAVATSIVLFIINRARPVTSDVPASPDVPAPSPVTLAPILGPRQAGLTATFSF